jgi:IclR family transcriptional regulator, acetate operon repressor
VGDSHDGLDDGALGRVQSLVRAFGLLDELAKNDSMTLSELARTASLPRSTAHRLLTTMEALRYVAFDRATNRWSIGVQAFTVGAVFAQTRDLGKLGRSIMRSLVSQVQHSVNIAVPEGRGVCYVGQVAGAGAHRTAARPGALLPLHTTASGKVIMAHWTRQEFDRYVARIPLQGGTAHSIVDADRLRGELTAIQERGYAVDDEEHERGLRCVAAMVHDRHGMPQGALSISDCASRLGRARLDDLGPTLVLAAQQMSSEISAQFF